MQEDERTRLKAEIVAELGRHLDEHYVTTKDFRKLAGAVDDVATDHEERIFHLEMVTALEEACRREERLRSSSTSLWSGLTGMLRAYKKRVSNRLLTLTKDSLGRPEFSAFSPETLQVMADIFADKDDR